MLAGKLNQYGMVSWFGKELSGHLVGLRGIISFIIVASVYLYIHYFFASATAHISALFPLSLALLIGAGVPAFPSAIGLGVMSNINGCLTQYGIGSGPVMYGAGYAGAQDRLFLMDVLRHTGRAELSSFVGGSRSNREMDRTQWGLAPYTEADLQKQIDLAERHEPLETLHLEHVHDGSDIEEVADALNGIFDLARLPVHEPVAHLIELDARFRLRLVVQARDRRDDAVVGRQAREDQIAIDVLERHRAPGCWTLVGCLRRC